MIAFREAASGLYGAWRLAHLDSGGHRWFDASLTGAVRSFWAAAIAFPAFLVIVQMRPDAEIDAGAMAGEADPVHGLIIQALGYAIMWTAFPVAAEWLVRIVDRAGRFFALICAWNWANVLSLVAQAAVQIVVTAGILPGPFATTVRIVVILAVLGYHGFVVKTALDVGWGAAVGFVLTDLTITMLITYVEIIVARG
jgi:hypothetical protein